LYRHEGTIRPPCSSLNNFICYPHLFGSWLIWLEQVYFTSLISLGHILYDLKKSIFSPLSLWACRSLGRAVPGQHVVLRKRPKHDPTIMSGRHGPDNRQAVLCLGQAKLHVVGRSGCWAAVLLTNYWLLHSLAKCIYSIICMHLFKTRKANE
jgi:hypothetical protein